MVTEDWTILAARRRNNLYNKIPIAWRLSKSLTDKIGPNVSNNVLGVPRASGILTDRELTITEDYDATALVEKLALEILTSYEVTLAFSKRAAIAHQVTFCLTEILFDEALARARQLDDHLAKTGSVVGPLHGLPISLKDLYKIKGIDATIGFIANLSEPPSSENSAIVDILLARGAVLYVKTNLPQTMMSLDSDNNVFGRTLNPHNSLWTPGGSSGGEGALIATRGSILGVGTDVAGSVRVPALCSGTYAFMPTANRVPYGRLQGAKRPGIPGIESAAGPLATSVRDIDLFFKSVLLDDIWAVDESALHLPWRKDANASPSKPLRIGVILESDHQPIHPPILLPGNQTVAPPHDTYGIPEYTVLANLLNFPAAVIPHLHAQEQADQAFRRDVQYKIPYDAKMIEGLPSHIQLIGKPLRDEELTSFADIVDDALRKG